MKDRYTLEIYMPESIEDAWVVFTSDTPFLAISKGDIINPSLFPDATTQKVLRVMSVEHIIWDLSNGQAKHKLCVYTREAANDENVRF